MDKKRERSVNIEQEQEMIKLCDKALEAMWDYQAGRKARAATLRSGGSGRPNDGRLEAGHAGSESDREP